MTDERHRWAHGIADPAAPVAPGASPAEMHLRRILRYYPLYWRQLNGEELVATTLDGMTPDDLEVSRPASDIAPRPQEGRVSRAVLRRWSAVLVALVVPHCPVRSAPSIGGASGTSTSTRMGLGGIWSSSGCRVLRGSTASPWGSWLRSLVHRPRRRSVRPGCRVRHLALAPGLVDDSETSSGGSPRSARSGSPSTGSRSIGCTPRRISRRRHRWATGPSVSIRRNWRDRQRHGPIWYDARVRR